MSLRFATGARLQLHILLMFFSCYQWFDTWKTVLRGFTPQWVVWCIELTKYPHWRHFSQHPPTLNYWYNYRYRYDRQLEDLLHFIALNDSQSQKRNIPFRKTNLSSSLKNHCVSCFFCGTYGNEVEGWTPCETIYVHSHKIRSIKFQYVLSSWKASLRTWNRVLLARTSPKGLTSVQPELIHKEFCLYLHCMKSL